MKVVYNSVLPFKGFKAVTIGPWIFCRHGTVLSPVDVNHETIHWEQYKELLIVFFPILYVIMFAVELVLCAFSPDRGRKKESRKNGLSMRAYRSIAFEREAYRHEEDMDYVAHRPSWNWLRE